MFKHSIDIAYTYLFVTRLRPWKIFWFNFLHTMTEYRLIFMPNRRIYASYQKRSLAAIVGSA